MERAARLQGPFLHISQIPNKKVPKIKKFIPSLKGPRKGASLHVPQKRGPYGNRRPFPEPYLAYLSGSPAKEPSLYVPLIELSRREMPHFQRHLHSSFTLPGIRVLFQVPQRGPYGKMLVTRTFLYLTFRVPTKRPPPLQVPLTQRP
jgi:hypothetical protein